MQHAKILFLFLFFALLSTSTLGISIGITPASIQHNNVLRGGYASSQIFLSTGEEQNVTGHISPSSNFGSWVSLGTGNLTYTIPAQSTLPITLIVRPPADTPSGNYTGYVDFLTDRVGSIQGRAGGFALSSVRLALRVEVIGSQVIGCTAGDLRIIDFEEGDSIEVTGIIQNTGNVRVRPQGQVRILSSEKNSVLSTLSFTPQEVLPTERERFALPLQRTNLPVGEYVAEFSVPTCSARSTSLFRIHEQGTIQDTAVLESLKSTPWVFAGDRVPVRAIFHNTGPRTTEAQLILTLSYQDQLVDSIEGPVIEVSGGAREEFIEFFDIQREGRYVVSGRVRFNKKFTNELGTVVNAQKQERNSQTNTITLLIYIALFLAIIFMFKLILAKKKRR